MTLLTIFDAKQQPVSQTEWDDAAPDQRKLDTFRQRWLDHDAHYTWHTLQVPTAARARTTGRTGPR